MQRKRFVLARLGFVLPMLLAVLLSTVSFDSSRSVAKASNLPSYTPWAVVVCKFADRPQDAHPLQYYNDLFTSDSWGEGGMFDYWYDMSFSALYLSGTTIKGPYVMSELSAAQAASMTPGGAARQCIGDALRDGLFNTSDPNYYGIIAVFNTSDVLSGYANDQGYNTILNFPGQPSKAYPLIQLNAADANNAARVAALMARGYGISLYGDYNFNTATTYQGNYFGVSGPALSGPVRDQLGWIGGSHQFNYPLDCPNGCATYPYVATVNLKTLDQYGQNGIVLAKAYNCATYCATYTVELRSKVSWDAGLSGDGVMIHRLNSDGTSSLVQNGGNYLWQTGQAYSDTDSDLRISVGSISNPGSVLAAVSVTIGPATVPGGSGGTGTGGGGGSSGGGSGGHPGCCHQQ